MKSLYNLCISHICYNLDKICPQYLPPECKEWILDFLVSHDLLDQAPRLLSLPLFSSCLKKVTLYLSEQVDDQLLKILGDNNKCLQHIAIVHCQKVTDEGVLSITDGQTNLNKLELRGLRHVTREGLQNVRSPNLFCLDLSDCPLICSDGVIDIVTRNLNLRCLYLNNCKAVSDMAIYAIASHLGTQLKVLQLDFLDHLQDPLTAITFLTQHCPNLTSLSLCRYFPPFDGITEFPFLHCKLIGIELKELDLFGNYFSVLPGLPENITSLRLSCCGTENVEDLKHKLDSMPHLKSFRLVIACRDSDEDSIEQVNGFLDAILPHCGDLLTGLQVQAYQLFDHSLRLVTHNCCRLSSLSLDVAQMHSILLMPLFVQMRGAPERPGRLRSVKLCGMRAVQTRLVLAMAKNCVNLREIQLSHMECVDYRMLRLLASNCPFLGVVNFNGCRFVTDKGVCAIARNCPLRELRVRATAVTDKCLYVLAQCCPTLEWIAHADYSGKPKFSAIALQALRDSCLQRVIC